MPLTYIFRILASAVSIFTFLCFLRIIITWVPSLTYSTFGRILSTICDPYLNIFRRIRFLRFSAFDLSPALAICVLYAISFFLINFSLGQFPTVGSILARILSLLWGVVSSILGFLAILLVIRLLVILFSRGYGSYGSIWEQLDRGLSTLVYRVSSILTGKRPVPYKNALIISVIILIAIYVGGTYLIDYLCKLLAALKF
ncbi:YggT family protein [Treponema zioleckii]|uniref:YggT family protein n=1 Tax=Treponema zioleckii TaxID=331680 RepID=UPI00168A6527|nr:YggT family protein [Treponema zioleckii]